MPVGPGKYDEEATSLRWLTAARGVVLIVFGGEHGTGFSVQVPEDVLRALPMLLRTMASEVEADVAAIAKKTTATATKEIK